MRPNREPAGSLAKSPERAPGLQHDDHLRGFAYGSRYIVGYHETEAGVPYIYLLNPTLERKDSPR